MRGHPHFLENGGKFSILAHSLGSVIVYDVLRQKWELDEDLNKSLPCSVSHGNIIIFLR